jgi:hypothetical protein
MNRLLFVSAGLVVISAVFLIAGCSDTYRYPCQDPENQKLKECNPPVCEADGTCTEYLIEHYESNS